MNLIEFLNIVYPIEQGTSSTTEVVIALEKF